MLLRHAAPSGALVLLAGLVLGCASAPHRTAGTVFLPDAVPCEVADVDSVANYLYLDGRTYIGGQPDVAALGELARRGVLAVVSLRTDREMADSTLVPFDMQAVADSLGLVYVHVPLGGAAHPYTPAAVDAVGEVLREFQGRVFLHCRMGGRASHVWAAYLGRHEGLTPDAAWRRGRQVGIGLTAFEQLLGAELRLEPRAGDQ
jgi:uncharacterized protein (TIGR01244 family)